MKRMILITTILTFMGMVSVSGQPQDAKTTKVKNNQADLCNDFYISYGTGTVYYFIENNSKVANSLSGTFLVGFARSLNKVIAVGFQVSYTNIGRSQSVSTSDNYTDNLWQGIANVRFRYLNKPSFCMYSGIGMGVTMDYYNQSNTSNSTTSKGQKLLPAGQITLLGFRIGRAFSFFGEFGIGTNSILNGGVSYKFGD